MGSADAVVATVTEPVSFALGDRLVTVSAPVRRGTAIRLTVLVERDGVDVTPASLNPVTVVDPPVRPDPRTALVGLVTDLVR